MEAVILGYAGHAYVVIDTLLSIDYKVVGYCEGEKKTIDPFQLSYFGDERDSDTLVRLRNRSVFLGLGDNAIRRKVYTYLLENGVRCSSAIHQKAWVSPLATVADGTIVMPGAVINAMAIVGAAVICNTASVIEHECVIGDYVHIAPGAVLAGAVSIGEGTFLGANAVVKQGISIGKNVIIGAGAVVTKDIADGLTVYGNPAREK